MIQRELVRSAHDCSDGGILVAAVEMAIGGDLGLELRADEISGSPDGATEDEPSAQRTLRAWFCEEASRYLLEVRPEHLDEVRAVVESAPNALLLGVIGQFNTSGRLTMPDDELDVGMDTLKQAWLATLDW